jgi:hypothetical protein
MCNNLTVTIFRYFEAFVFIYIVPGIHVIINELYCVESTVESPVTKWSKTGSCRMTSRDSLWSEKIIF